jgi:hypothetical protein
MNSEDTNQRNLETEAFKQKNMLRLPVFDIRISNEIEK